VPRKLRELRRDLRREGYSPDRQTGSHQIWEHPAVPGFSVNLAGRDGADAQRYQEELVRDGIRRARVARQRKEHGE